MRGSKLAHIAPQARQKVAPGTLRAHTVTKNHSLPSCSRVTNRPTMTLSEMDTSKRQLGAGDLRHRAHLAPVKRYQGATAGLGGPWSDPGCSSHQDRSPTGDAAVSGPDASERSSFRRPGPLSVR